MTTVPPVVPISSSTTCMLVKIYTCGLAGHYKAQCLCHTSLHPRFGWSCARKGTASIHGTSTNKAHNEWAQRKWYTGERAEAVENKWVKWQELKDLRSAMCVKLVILLYVLCCLHWELPLLHLYKWMCLYLLLPLWVFQLARQYGVPYLETSALEDINVKEVRHWLCDVLKPMRVPIAFSGAAFTKKKKKKNFGVIVCPYYVSSKCMLKRSSIYLHLG